MAARDDNNFLVVGLFENRPLAEGAIGDLQNLGIRQDDIRENTQGLFDQAAPEIGRETGRPASVKLISDQGVPEEDAEIYAEGVRRGGTLLVVRCAESNADQARDLMDRHGAMDLDQLAEEYRSTGWVRGQAAGRTMTAGRSQPPLEEEIETGRAGAHMVGEQHIPIIKERLAVGKKATEARRVRVYTHVVSHPVEEQVSLRDETVVVERHPVDRPVSGSEAFREQSIEMTEMHEEPVVGKQARVVEEVTIGKEAHEHMETVRDTVRETEVEVEGAGTTSSAFDFGSTMANDTRFRGRTFESAEADLRREYERENPGSSWDNIRDSVRRGWDTITGKR